MVENGCLGNYRPSVSIKRLRKDRWTYIQDIWHCSGSYPCRNRTRLGASDWRWRPCSQRMMLINNLSLRISKIHRKEVNDGSMYVRLVGPPTKPKTLLMFTIHPRSPLLCGSCCSICVIAYLQPRNTERAFTRMVRSQSDSSRRWMGLGFLDSMAMPALLINLAHKFSYRMT